MCYEGQQLGGEGKSLKLDIICSKNKQLGFLCAPSPPVGGVFSSETFSALQIFSSKMI